MPVTYRPARVDDLEQADALVVTSINDLTERHGFGRIASPSPPRFQAFCLSLDPRGLWVAESEGEMLGFAWSWTRETFWFLAQLFVRPGVQAQGIGGELLKRTLAQANEAGSTNRALITFAFNSVSQGLYIQHGLMPRFPIYALALPRNQIRIPVGLAMLQATTINALEQDEAIAEIDRVALGVARGDHHRWLSHEPGLSGYALHEDERLVGTVYISEAGHIGPLAVTAPELTERALLTALSLAAAGLSEMVSCLVPGANEALLRLALGQGMRIRLPLLLMSAKDPGRWPCYLPRNPGFM